MPYDKKKPMPGGAVNKPKPVRENPKFGGMPVRNKLKPAGKKKGMK